MHVFFLVGDFFSTSSLFISFPPHFLLYLNRSPTLTHFSATELDGSFFFGTVCFYFCASRVIKTIRAWSPEWTLRITRFNPSMKLNKSYKLRIELRALLRHFYHGCSISWNIYTHGTHFQRMYIRIEYFPHSGTTYKQQSGWDEMYVGCWRNRNTQNSDKSKSNSE